MDERTTQDQENVSRDDNLKHPEKMEKPSIHDTDDDGFNQDSLDRSSHLLYVSKKIYTNSI